MFLTADLNQLKKKVVDLAIGRRIILRFVEIATSKKACRSD